MFVGREKGNDLARYPNPTLRDRICESETFEGQSDYASFPVTLAVDVLSMSSARPCHSFVSRRTVVQLLPPRDAKYVYSIEAIS